MNPAFSPDDHRHMARALQLAEQGLYTTRPNPRVGCVIVKRGDVIGEGYHARAGAPHAEVLALRQAGEAARGSTVYVTLEPCAHTGRTPPCANALIAAGVAEVIVAMEDPNPQVAGQGLERLLEAGIAVREGLMADEAEALNPGFIDRMSTGLPYVRVKLAASLDGRTALQSGESKWITSADARADAHRLRARSCAIVTGIGTVLADNPALTVRDIPLPEAWPGQPRRVVLDKRLTLPPAAAVLKEGGALVFHAADTAPSEALRAAGAQLEPVPLRMGEPDLEAVLRRLAALGMNEVLVEAGPTLAGAFMREGLADELVIYLAPHLMGSDGAPLLRLPGIEAMDDRIGLEIVDVRAVGPDLRICAKLGAPRQTA